jgi:hypothetical protein
MASNKHSTRDRYIKLLPQIHSLEVALIFFKGPKQFTVFVLEFREGFTVYEKCKLAENFRILPFYEIC